MSKDFFPIILKTNCKPVNRNENERLSELISMLQCTKNHNSSSQRPNTSVRRERASRQAREVNNQAWIIDEAHIYAKIAFLSLSLFFSSLLVDSIDTPAMTSCTCATDFSHSPLLFSRLFALHTQQRHAVSQTCYEVTRRRRTRRRRKKVYSSGCHHTATAGEKHRIVVITTAIICYRCTSVHKNVFLSNTLSVTESEKRKKMIEIEKNNFNLFIYALYFFRVFNLS